MWNENVCMHAYFVDCLRISEKVKLDCPAPVKTLFVPERTLLLNRRLGARKSFIISPYVLHSTPMLAPRGLTFVPNNITRTIFHGNEYIDTGCWKWRYFKGIWQSSFSYDLVKFLELMKERSESRWNIFNVFHNRGETLKIVRWKNENYSYNYSGINSQIF